MMEKTKEMAREVSVLMPRIARRILLGFFQSYEIPPTQIFAIMTLYEKKSCHIRDLSQELHISAPTATGIIDRLEKSGCVKRAPDSKDRRAINIMLTKKGIRFARSLRLTIRKRWQSILKKLPSKDSENYLRILKKIQESL